MSMNTELLQFLDGSLHPEQEAELLHRLSVSPERRDLLRSFLNQQVLFQRDRNSIAVPYAAEQKLWARLGGMMVPLAETAATPTAAVIDSAATTASHTGIFSSVFSAASVAVICLLIGLGSGYFAGKNSISNNVISGSPLSEQTSFNGGEHNFSQLKNQSELSSSSKTSLRNFTAKHNGSFNAAQNTIVPNSGAPLVTSVSQSQNVVNESIANTNGISNNSLVSSNSVEEMNANSALSQISTVTPKQLSFTDFNSPNVRDPNQYWEHSPFNTEDQAPQKTFLQKWEFSYYESIGKQFPNNAATNVSMPVVTNSSISALFQPFANSLGFQSHIWFGGSFGTANVTMKKFSIVQIDPLDPKKGLAMAADLVHVQTSYVGALLQYRIAMGAKWAGTITGMGAPSSAGTIWSAELGTHYDATSNFGFVAGVRGTYLSYNLDAQQQQVIAQGVSAFGIPAPVASQAKQQSYNLEISSGIYFHF